VLSGTDVRDATSGFRAFSREAALHLQVHGQYTYTLETIIQVGAEGLKLKAVPIGVNPQSRPSRLVKSSFDYVRRSIPTIIRSYARYKPLRFFTWLAAIPGVAGIALVVRWFILRFDGDEASRVPSLVGAAVCLLMAAQLLVLGFLADIQAAQRKTTSDILVMLRRREFAPTEAADDRPSAAPSGRGENSAA
jgi:hypothetical protein